MAERYDFYVHDTRKITFNLTEPIMREDSGVTDFVFHIPKILNELEVSDWQWWLVFVNAKKEKYSIALTLSDDPERPLEYNLATYTVDYAMSIKAGSVQFALEAINAGTGGAIDNEWHTLTYETKVKETLQGNQAEYAETESDIISALIQEVRTKMNQIVGGATPTPVSSVSAMTDTSKLYLLTTDGEWYYYNGSAWVSGGVYGAGTTDAIPTQGSTNAVSSGGVYEALRNTDTTFSQSGQAADAKETGDRIRRINKDIAAGLDYSGIELSTQKRYIVANWVHGTIRNNNGQNIDTIPCRVRTENTLYTSTDITLYAEKTYSVLIYYYDANGTFIRVEEKGQDKYITIPAGSYYRAVIRRVPDDTSVTADIFDYVTHVYHDFSVMYLRSDKEQTKTEEEQVTALRNIGTTGFKNFFPETELTKNLYNPDYEIKGKRIDLNTGSIVDDSDYNLYKIVVPSGKTLVCTGIKSNLPTERSYPNIVRSNVVYNNYGIIESSDSQSATASVYKNTATTPRTIYLNLWSDTNPYLTVDDLMIELVDNAASTSEYITDYVPYGFVSKNKVFRGMENKLHNPRSFFENEINDTVNSVVEAQDGVNYTFAFVTDTHYTPNDDKSFVYTADTFSNVKRISELVPLDAVIHGGDFVSVGWGGTTQAETNSAINMMRGWMSQANVCRDVHITPGNHDGIDGRSTPSTGLYGVMMTQDANIVTRAGASYDYYYDVKAPKLRVIVISNAIIISNTIGVSNDGVQWLTDTLASTPSGYNVMVISHISPSSTDFVTNKDAVVNALNTWHNNPATGKVVAWIAGHEHFDWIVPSSVSGCDFPVIICTCSFRNAINPSAEQISQGAELVSPRTPYTKLQDAWTVFVYRPDIGQVKKIRFGAGNDANVDYENWNSTL